MVIMKPTPTPEEKGGAVDGGELKVEGEGDGGGAAEEGGGAGGEKGGEEGGEVSLEPVRAPEQFPFNKNSRLIYYPQTPEWRSPNR